MEEGKILKWLVKEGDEVANGDVIAEIETDKADMEYEVIEDGTMLKIFIGEGETAPVGKLMAIIGEEGEEVNIPETPVEASESTPAEPETVAEKPVAAEETSTVTEPEIVPEPEPVAPVETKAPEVDLPPAPDPSHELPEPVVAVGEVIKASPVARKLADSAGIDIKTIQGTGPEGRVIKRDVEAVIGGKTPPAPAPAPEPSKLATAVETIVQPAEKPAEPAVSKPEPAPTPVALAAKREPMSGMRKTIAKRLVESKVTIPHFYLTIEVDMGPLMEAHRTVNEQENVKISVNDFIVKACAKALQSHPLVNAHIEGDEIVYLDSVDVGVAVALDEGLITPYVRNCQEKTLGLISAEIKELAGRAKVRKLKPEEYSGGSITVSNLGMFGIDYFTAIINPPESTILAVGKSKEVPVVVDGELTVGWRMKLTLSCDHRIVDGATGARFLSTLREILENPVRMLV